MSEREWEILSKYKRDRTTMHTQTEGTGGGGRGERDQCKISTITIIHLQGLNIWRLPLSSSLVRCTKYEIIIVYYIGTQIYSQTSCDVISL